MLHITNNSHNHHRKAFTAEVFMSLMLLAIFSSSLAQASDITADMVIKLTNGARESIKVATLKKNNLLMKAAEEKAQDMIDNDYFAHVSPQGKSPWDFIQESGYDYRYAGENLAISFTSAEEEQKAWMDSELHRKNILNSDYEEIGVAVKSGVINGKKTTVAVQEFGAKMPKVVADAKPVEKTQSKTVVAGTAIKSIEVPSQIESVQRISDKITKNALFENNIPTRSGWLGMIAIVLIAIIFDVKAVAHRKHDQMFRMHDAGRRHV